MHIGRSAIGLEDGTARVAGGASLPAGVALLPDRVLVTGTGSGKLLTFDR